MAGESGPEGGEAVKYVWYGSYGSNMWEERFLSYIRGGKVEGMSVECGGCRDPSLPLSCSWLLLPHRSWFGRSRTATWGAGGVCFLDPHPSAPASATLAVSAPSAASLSAPAHTTLLRLYKITVQQFNDVVAQENMRSAPPNTSCSPLPLLPWSLISRLRSSLAPPVPPPACASAKACESPKDEAGQPEANGGLHSPQCAAQDRQAEQPGAEEQRRVGRVAPVPHLEVIPGGWYGTVLLLGDQDGCPILTFTCSPSDALKFHSGLLPVNAPSPTYRAAVKRGLAHSGMPDSAIEEYIDLRSKPLCS